MMVRFCFIFYFIFSATSLAEIISNSHLFSQESVVFLFLFLFLLICLFCFFPTPKRLVVDVLVLKYTMCCAIDTIEAVQGSKIWHSTWNWKLAYTLIKVQFSEWSCRRRKMKIRLHKYEICCVLINIKIGNINLRPGYKNINKIITFLSYLPRVKMNSCFLFRRHKRFSKSFCSILLLQFSCIHRWWRVFWDVTEWYQRQFIR